MARAPRQAARPRPKPPDDDALETGRKLFARPCRFIAGVADYDQLPEPSRVEVAFAGRSNVGKSSLINALTGRSSLARISRTPGRTQQLNFFDLGETLILVDLPGYGYAQASKSKVRSWTRLTLDYLKGRPTLRRLCLLVDARHGFKPPDEETMDILDAAAVAYQIVLTKSDKLQPAELERRIAEVSAALSRRPAAHPEVLATSAETGAGIAELRAALAALAQQGRFD